MNIRKVRAGRGWQWVVEGVALFKKSPVNWFLMVGVILVAAKIVMMIKFVGLLVLLVAPVVLIGFMEGCRALEYGKDLKFGYLLSGFVRNTAGLITLGGVSLAGNFLSLVVITTVGGEAIAEVMKFMAQQKVTPENAHLIRDAASQAMMAGLAGWIISIPLMMALWFAPLLVYFNNLKPLNALLHSFWACWKNFGAFLLYGMVLAAALMLATPVAMATRVLDLALWLIMPVVIPTIYASYKDIFDINETAGTDTPAATS